MIASALATSSVTLSATTLVLVRLGETVSVAAVVPGSMVAEPEVVPLSVRMPFSAKVPELVSPVAAVPGSSVRVPEPLPLNV